MCWAATTWPIRAARTTWPASMFLFADSAILSFMCSTSSKGTVSVSAPNSMAFWIHGQRIRIGKWLNGNTVKTDPGSSKSCKSANLSLSSCIPAYGTIYIFIFFSHLVTCDGSSRISTFSCYDSTAAVALGKVPVMVQWYWSCLYMNLVFTDSVSLRI